MIKRDITQRDKTAVSIIWAFVVCMLYFNRLFGEWFNTGGAVFSIVTLGALMIVCYKTMVKVKISAVVLVYGLIVALYYAVTRQIAYTTVDIGRFLFSFCAVSVLAMYQCDTEKFLRYASYMSMLIWPYYTEYFVKMSYSEGGYIEMGLSYALFPLLLAPVFHFLFYRKEKHYKLMYIIYIVSVFLLAKLAFNGTRGIILSIIVAVALIYIKGLDKKNVSRYHLLRALVVFTVVFVLMVYFYEIVDWMRSFLKSLGIEAYFLEKITRLSDAGDVSNGRWSLFEYTIKEIWEKPVLGHGIASMAYYGGRGYAHNFLLQLLYDGGLVLTIPVIFFLVKAVYYAFRGGERDEVVFVLFMISITLPRAFFSGDIWVNTGFWLLVIHSAKYYHFKKKTGFRDFLQPIDGEDLEEKPADEVLDYDKEFQNAD